MFFKCIFLKVQKSMRLPRRSFLTLRFFTRYHRITQIDCSFSWIRLQFNLNLKSLFPIVDIISYVNPKHFSHYNVNTHYCETLDLDINLRLAGSLYLCVSTLLSTDTDSTYVYSKRVTKKDARCKRDKMRKICIEPICALSVQFDTYSR